MIYTADTTESPSRYKRIARFDGDGRTTTARLIREYKTNLLEQCGPDASPTQRALIDLTAKLHLRLLQLDQQSAGKPMAEADARQYAQFASCLATMLRQLESSMPARVAA